MVKLTHRYATSVDVEHFYNGLPSPTMRAVVVLMDEKPAVLIGVAQARMFSVFFAEISDAARPFLGSMAVLRAMKKVIAFVQATPGPVLCDSDNADLMSRLRKLAPADATGFVPIGKDLYQWAS